MQLYIDQIMSISNKLNDIGFPISEEWMGAILLAGFSDKFAPFIMGIEATGSEITADSIISKLLDSQAMQKDGEAFVSKGKAKRNFRRRTVL